MSPRVAGAALAVIAALLLASSITGVPAGWWEGAPTRNGEPMHKKAVNVSMIRAVGCNTGGDESCEPLKVASTFGALRYAEAGSSGILALVALLLAGAAAADNDRRKTLAKITIGVAVVSGVLAIPLLLSSEQLTNASIGLPISPLGLAVFGGGLACAIGGAIFAMQPTPRLALQPSRQSYAPGLAPPPPASSQPVDVLALLKEEPAPSAPPTTEPPGGRPPPSPGGQLAGPAGPLAPPQQTYGTAPRLAAFTAPEPPPLMAPTPFPGSPSPFGARPGGPPLATPPPDGRARSASVAPPLPSSTDPRSKSGNLPALPGSDSRAKSVSVGPPLPPSKVPSLGPPSAEARTKAASVSPPVRAKAPSLPPGPRTHSPSVPPPPLGPPSTVAGLVPPPRSTGLPSPRSKGPSVPPPAGTGVRVALPTIAGAVVPPPSTPRPLGPILPMTLPTRAETDPSEGMETVDREAMTIQRDGASSGSGVSVGRPMTNAGLGIGDAGDEHTELGAQPVSPDDAETRGRERFSASELARDSASDIHTSARPRLSPSELIRAVARESQNEIETIAREKLSASDLAVGDSTSPAISSPPVASSTFATPNIRVPNIPVARPEVSTPTPAPSPPIASPPPNIPVSTAPDSLPPPKEAAASGPSPACPQCEAPMAWVEEHLRFYCKSCRMYF
ncbi:MAG: hypothetical protein JWP01_4199 [Myxococcales bacterium]|nr:hypothetical protein [Myxococcales bacterium]